MHTHFRWLDLVDGYDALDAVGIGIAIGIGAAYVWPQLQQLLALLAGI